MKTILHATDYSENSISALKYAYNMALEIDARLIVLHVFNYPSVLRSESQESSSQIENNAIQEHIYRLEQLCENHLENDIEKMNVTVKAIKNKSAVDAINSIAIKNQSLLIITGMKGTSQLRRLIMGSTAKGLFESSTCPVLIIPEDASYNGIKTIVYATDFETEDLDAIDNLSQIAIPFDAKIKIVHIAPIEKKIEEERKKILEDKIANRVDYKNLELDILYSDDVFNVLKIYSGKLNADIIAMLNRESRSYISEIFYTNLVEKMKSYGRMPLLSFNAKNYGKFHL